MLVALAAGAPGLRGREAAPAVKRLRAVLLVGCSPVAPPRVEREGQHARARMGGIISRKNAKDQVCRVRPLLRALCARRAATRTAGLRAPRAVLVQAAQAPVCEHAHGLPVFMCCTHCPRLRAVAAIGRDPFSMKKGLRRHIHTPEPFCRTHVHTCTHTHQQQTQQQQNYKQGGSQGANQANGKAGKTGEPSTPPPSAAVPAPATPAPRTSAATPHKNRPPGISATPTDQPLAGRPEFSSPLAAQAANSHNMLVNESPSVRNFTEQLLEMQNNQGEDHGFQDLEVCVCVCACVRVCVYVRMDVRCLLVGLSFQSVCLVGLSFQSVCLSPCPSLSALSLSRACSIHTHTHTCSYIYIGGRRRRSGDRGRDIIV